MNFKVNLNGNCFEDTLYLYNDESIVSDNAKGFDLYFDKFTFGLTINREEKKLRNFTGYSSDFLPTKSMIIPKAKKGEIFIDELPDGDGNYYPEEYGFIAKGFYDIETGWYRVGEEFSTGEVVEIATNTLINIENKKIKTIYFKPQIKK